MNDMEIGFDDGVRHSLLTSPLARGRKMARTSQKARRAYAGLQAFGLAVAGWLHEPGRASRVQNSVPTGTGPFRTSGTSLFTWPNS
jgi:hypothetical protein